MVGLLLIVIVYSLIMTEVIHRTSAALLGASLGIAALSILNMVIVATHFSTLVQPCNT